MKLQKILHIFGIIIALFLGIVASGLVYALTWPTTPVGEYLYGGFVSYLEKALVSSGATTDGIVKKVVDTNNLGSGTIISTASGYIGVGTSTPQANFDVNGNTKIPNLQFNSTTLSGYMIVGDVSGNASWSYNNYRTEVTSLMRNMGDYGTSCFVMGDTTVKCVGYNGNGEMGIGTTVSNYYLPRDSAISGVKKLISANLDILALMNDGSIYALGGYNSFGELGVGGASTLYSPYKISGITNATDVVISGSWNGGSWISHSCALLSTGGVKCWGYNGYGQVGDGSVTSRYTPVDAVGITNAVKIMVTQGEHPGASCALLGDGTIKCWGWNGHSNLGTGDATDRVTPTTVVGITNAIDFDLGGSYGHGIHACAILADKTVKCWGYNAHGQTGNGGSTNVATPTIATGLSNIKKVVISGGTGYSTYAITTDGQVYSWGYNAWGNLGVGDATIRYTPTLIPGLSGVVDIKSAGRGSVSTCALINDGTAKCWGYNAQGQLGVGDASNRYSPTQVMITEKIKDIEIYESYYSSRPWTCALMYNGSVMCWGRNGFGQLGQNNTNNYNIPVTVKNLNKN